MPQIYLGLGSNMGDREALLAGAIEGLRTEVVITAVSPIYETAPWGVTDQPDFLNLCLAGETRLEPLRLLEYVKGLERDLGRLPAERWGPRAIDIDILFYDQLVLQVPGLSIPHPGVAQRATVLVPLADIAPQLRHPVTRKTVTDMLCEVDRSGVFPYH